MDHSGQEFGRETGKATGYQPGINVRVGSNPEIRDELISITPALKPLADDTGGDLGPAQLQVFSREMKRLLDEEIASSGSHRLQTMRDRWFAANPRRGRLSMMILVVGILLLLAAAVFYAGMREGFVSMPRFAQVPTAMAAGTVASEDRVPVSFEPQNVPWSDTLFTNFG